MSTLLLPQRLINPRRATFDLSIRRQTLNSPTPALTIRPPSGEVKSFLDASVKASSKAIWRCCHCHSEHPIALNAGRHPLGALACHCPHKPCSTCSLTGATRPFLLINEPAIIPLSPSKEILFGTICPACGFSWRGAEVERCKKTVRKMPSLSMAQLHQVRLTPDRGKLRKRRSNLVMGSARVVSPPGLGAGKQSEFSSVRFSVGCTCGVDVKAVGALCFQIVGGEEVLSVGGEDCPGRKEAELRRMGHERAMIELVGIEHPNPLRSCPVTAERMEHLEPFPWDWSTW